MDASHPDGTHVTGAYRVLRLLDALRATPAGVLIYRQVERLLDDEAHSQQQIQHGYVTLVHRLLDAYASHLDENSTFRVQVRLLQARLEPPLFAADLDALNDYIELYASQIESLPRLDAGLLQAAISPLLEAFGIVVDKDDVAEPVLQPARAVTAPAAAGVPPDDAADSSDSGSSTATREAPGSGDDDHDEEGMADLDSRSRADSPGQDILRLQSTLANQVMASISQNEEFGVLLEVVLGELRHSPTGKDLEDLRWTLIREIEKLTRGHHELAENLDSTHHYLQQVESDSRQLSDELTRVRLLSLTDELTALPNRRAFLRRIEDEVARVQRYGFPLSLALIDLDHFKQVNDRYGHAGGDEVLKIYSRSILSIFRHHDLVARYGGEEFAVLLPNTVEEGSMRALNKVKARALETRWQSDEEMIPVPTFSAGVSLYKPGETASAFIERADKALYRAKKLGRNRVELDATYQSNVAMPEADPVADS